MTTQTQKKTEMTVKEATAYSKIVASEWAEDNADLLTCFHGETVNQALFGLFASTHRTDQPIHYAEMCRGFLHLYDGGVLVPEFPVTGVADEQLQDMRARFAPTTKSTTQSTTEKVVDPDDFSQMSREQFDSIGTSDARRLYRSDRSFQARADYFWGGGN